MKENRLERMIIVGPLIRTVKRIGNYFQNHTQIKTEQTSELTPYDHIILSRLHKNYLRKTSGLSQNHIHSRETTVPE